MSHAPLQPARIEAILFDVIGTLVDEDATWASTAERLAQACDLAHGTALREPWEQGLAQRMDAVVAGTAPWQPHRALVVDAAREAVAIADGVLTPEGLDVAAAMDAEHRAWPEVAQATAALRSGRIVAAISNGDVDALARVANREGIAWDAVLSAGAVRTFKPAPAAYRHAIDALRLDPGRTLFVAAHPWDLRAAAGHGFRTAYVARPGAERPSGDDRFDLVVDDLGALVDALAGEGREPR